MRWGRPGQGWTYGSVQHCNNLPTKRGTQLHTNVDWKKFQRQRDHYHDDEPDTDQCVPVCTSSSSHDSPLMMLCMDQWPVQTSWAIRNIEAEINKKLSEYWIVTAPVTPPTAVTDNPVSACVWASSVITSRKTVMLVSRGPRCQQPLPGESGQIQYHRVAAPRSPARQQ